MPAPKYESYNGTAIAPTPPNLPTAPAAYNQAHDNQVLSQLRLYFNQLNNYTQATATPNYGATSGRPTHGLQTGQPFFDTTLGIPIWYNGAQWVNASGTGV